MDTNLPDDHPHDGGPAFPVEAWVTEHGDRVYATGSGMSLRDWFAGQALIGVQTAQIHGALTGSGTPFLDEADTAEAAYRIADAMLDVRKR